MRNNGFDDVYVRIRNEVNIASVIKDLGLPITSRGKTLCLFHDDKTPSAQIYSGTNRCHCFACGANVSNIDIVQQHFGYTCKEAAIYLGDNYGVDVSELKEEAHVREERKEPEQKPIIISAAMLSKVGLKENPFIQASCSNTSINVSNKQKDVLASYKCLPAGSSVALEQRAAADLVIGKCDEYIQKEFNFVTVMQTKYRFQNTPQAERANSKFFENIMPIMKLRHAMRDILRELDNNNVPEILVEEVCDSTQRDKNSTKSPRTQEEKLEDAIAKLEAQYAYENKFFDYMTKNYPITDEKQLAKCRQKFLDNISKIQDRLDVLYLEYAKTVRSVPDFVKESLCTEEERGV